MPRDFGKYVAMAQKKLIVWMNMQRVHCRQQRLERRFKNFFMILVIHIKFEERSKVFEGLTISNRRHNFGVDEKLWLELK